MKWNGLKEGVWLDTVCWKNLLDADVKLRRFRPNKHFVLLRSGVNTLFSYNLWGTSAQLLASNHKTEIRSVFQAGEDKRAVLVFPFLLNALRLTLPQSLQLPLLFSDHLRNSTKIFSSILQPPYFHFYCAWYKEEQLFDFRVMKTCMLWENKRVEL